MPYDARAVANAFIQLGLDNSRPITPMAAMKMTYLAQAYHLGHTGQPLIQQEIVDWVYGPVIWDVYYALRRYGGEPVPRLIEGYPANLAQAQDNSLAATIIKDTYRVYKDYTNRQLSHITSAKDTPWHRNRTLAEKIGSFLTEKLPETRFWKDVKVFLPQVKPGILPNRHIAQVHRQKLQNAGLLESRP